MCCFAQHVLSVTATKIFGRLISPGVQVLAYEMMYESAEPNAMILPLPTDTSAGESAVRFISLENYEYFFSHLERGFPRTPRISIGCGDSTMVVAANAAIEVHEVGITLHHLYQASPTSIDWTLGLLFLWKPGI